MFITSDSTPVIWDHKGLGYSDEVTGRCSVFLDSRGHLGLTLLLEPHLTHEPVD